MSKETEQVISKLNKYMEQFDFNNDEQMEKEMRNFIQKLNNNEINFEDDPKFKSDDLLEEAYNATSKTNAIKLAKKALEIYPDNIDAECFIADFEENQIRMLEKYNTIVDKATRLLEKDNMFEKENIGIFWEILETRPYMRARYKKADILVNLGRFTEAIKECKELLRLNKSDNLGVRYMLIKLYCMLEKFEECEKLYKKYNEHSAFMLLPMAIMYFKKGDYIKSKRILRNVQKVNPYIIKFLKNINEMEEQFIGNIKDIEYYSQGSIEEAAIIIGSLLCLLLSIPAFVEFVELEIKN